MRQMLLWNGCVGAALVVAAAGVARGDIDPLSGIDFVNITHPGNAPWAGDGTAGDRAVGRGGVDYEYKIGKYEVNTAQWCEFMNAAYDRPAGNAIPHVAYTGVWGAVATTPINSSNPDARRWTVPAGREMRAVGEITWRTAAIYCNWLTNNKSLEHSAFMNGAYDVTTFGFEIQPNGIRRFTDQFEHTPGAAYYIPTWDEWLKAAHYDPAKSNPDGSTGGWWTYSNGSDQPWVGAPPSAGGTANFGFGPSPNPFVIPLGAYSGTSPWGLYDVAGATTEWTESLQVVAGTGERLRYFDGSEWNSSQGLSIADSIYSRGSTQYPNDPGLGFGLRIASVIPAPSSLVFIALGMLPRARRRSRNGGSVCATCSPVSFLC